MPNLNEWIAEKEKEFEKEFYFIIPPKERENDIVPLPIGLSDDFKKFLSSSIRQAAELTIAAGKLEEKEPTLCGKCDFNGELCRSCYGHRAHNAAITEQENKIKDFLASIEGEKKQ